MFPIRLLIIAEDILARIGLTTLLAGQPDIEVVGQVDGSTTSLQSIDLYTPDALLWATNWNRNNQELGANLSEIGLPVLILAPDGESTATFADFIANEPNEGYAMLTRSSDASMIVSALQSIAHGLIVFDPSFLALMSQTSHLPVPLVESLTPREQEVLQLLAQGLTNKAIAQALTITDHTVKYHVNAIMGKLGAQSRTDAVIRATRAGLISL